MERVAVEAVPGAGWRDTLAAAVGRGERFAGLFGATDPAGVPEARAVFLNGSQTRLVRTVAPDGRVPTVVDLIPAAGWDEREAAELGGITPVGHEPLWALVNHPEDPAAWTVPVEGEDVHRVPVGPIHAGVIESGHFLFHVVGERVLHVDVRLFYKHRGLERAAEGGAPADALEVLRRVCAGCAASNAAAVCMAAEDALGLAPDEPLRRARTLLVELERIWNHLNDVGQLCAGVGLAPGSMFFASLKERAQRLCAELTGHRFMFGAVRLGGSPAGPADAERERLRADLAAIAADAAAGARNLLFDASLRDRTAGAGMLPADAATRLGVVGPAARASHRNVDSRLYAPRLWYPGFALPSVADPAGDVAARLEQRWVEIAQSAAIADAMLAEPMPPGTARPAGGPERHGVGAVESPRGETVCAIELADGLVRRVRLRTSSYANWPAVALAATGGILPDFPLVNKSFELCYACADR